MNSPCEINNAPREKKYVILTGSIIGMGGGQKYCSNKIESLKRKGYLTYIISAINGEVLIDSLKPYKSNTVSEMFFAPKIYTIKQRKNIVQRIESIIGNISEETIIDSTNVACAEWGELIAAKNKCKHICFFIDESFRIEPMDADFLEFKLKRGELFGSSEKTIPIIFSHSSRKIPEGDYTFVPYCRNVVEDIQTDIEFNEKLKCICCFGRLEKEYIYQDTKKIIPFFERHKDEHFVLLLLGGSDDYHIEKMIKKMYKPIKNVDLICTGYLYPIPKSLFKKMDVCIAGAGCAKVSAYEEVMTIAVNVFTGEPDAIIEYTSDVTTDDRYGEAIGDINDILEEILYQDYSRKHTKKFPLKRVSIEEKIDLEIDKQIIKISKTKSKQYFNIMDIKCEENKSKLYRVFCFLFGARKVYHLRYHIYPSIIKNKLPV